MAAREYQAVRRTDQEVIDAFRKIDKDFGANGESHVHIQLVDGLANALTAKLSAIDQAENIKTLLDNKRAIAHFLQIQLPDRRSHIRVTRDAGFDKVGININNDVDATTTVKVLAIVGGYLPGFETAALIERTLGVELKEFYGRREESLMRLEQLSQKLIEQNEQYRRTLDAQMADEEARLGQEARSAIEKTAKEFEAKEAEVAKRADELAAREKELDDRTSRHVRRQIRKEFLEKLASREKQFQLSKATSAKRMVIHALFVLLLVASGVFAYGGIAALLAGRADLYAYLRLAVGFAGFAATTVYYIRWNDQWFRQHADEEFRLQRLALDFDRASWVVEMALEWKQEKEEEIPRELIDRLTANLFSATSGSETLRHPAEDAIAAILGASTSLKLNLPGGAGEVAVDKKGLQKLKPQ